MTGVKYKYIRMKKATVKLLSDKDTLPFIIQDASDNNVLFDCLIEWIKLALCGEVKPDEEVFFQPIHKNHIDNMERLKVHLAKEYPELKLPQLNAIPSWLKKVGEGNFFAVCFNRNPPLEEVLAIQAKIKELNGGERMEDNLCKTQELAKDVFENYDVFASDNTKRILYGTESSDKRTCRYCHRMEPEVTFLKKAHTFSEGLGNKFTITYNECDECNEYFGNKCEPDLIAYLDIIRPLFHVKGKDGEINKIDGRNFTVTNDATDKKILNIKIKQTPDNLNPIEETDGQFVIGLNHSKKVIPQNIYKALVKFCYGILPNDCLDKFAFTADWLLGKVEIGKLPLVMISQGNTFINHPRVVAYIRKNDRLDLPFAIGEFWVMNNIFVYVIPIDENNLFREEQDWEVLKHTFQYYTSIKWSYKDFSSTTSQQMKFHLNIEKQNLQ